MVFDEIKHLYKLATAGSQEARLLETAKHNFEKAYREAGKVSAAEGADVKNSINETTDGRFAAVVDNDILRNIDTTTWDKATKKAAQKAASAALKQFKDGIVVEGITHKVNKTSRDEYTRSNYTDQLYRESPDVFADKMRAADVADDIIVAATNWTRDGELTHPREDNFVDFDRGQTLIVSGDSKYVAEVVVGITAQGDAVFYDVVDMQPAEFETKKSESSTAVTTQNAPVGIHEEFAGDILPQNGQNVNRNSKNSDKKHSLSDTLGRTISKEQQEYFKDSVVRDESGNLKVMYHGTSKGGHTVFDTYGGKYGLFGIGSYFTESKNMAESYTNKGRGTSPQVYESYLNMCQMLKDASHTVASTMESLICLLRTELFLSLKQRF